MSSLVVFEAKGVSETISLPVDFSDKLQFGESITGASTFASLFSGTDPTPQNVVNGNPTFTETGISQSITGGIAGNIYTLEFLVTASNSHNYLKVGQLAVISDSDPF